MNPINPVKNQYGGINAHLHSYWQAVGGWDEFHANHIAVLTAVLKARLRPLGYTADNQPSLQIRSLGEIIARPEADVMIYDTQAERIRKAHVPKVAGMEAVAIPEIMDVQELFLEYSAIGIYQAVSHSARKGEPVAWIELLSPSNKPGGQDFNDYRRKRLKVLESQVVFVEMDYLHESISTFDYLPRYYGVKSRRQRDENAHPYRIVVLDPRTVDNKGIAYPHEFDVDAPMPSIKIPLKGTDVLEFDFSIPYEQTLSQYFYAEELADYTKLPLNFDRYSPDDQARILNRMIAVLEAAQQGKDLEVLAPLPAGTLPLDEALSKVQALGVAVS